MFFCREKDSFIYSLLSIIFYLLSVICSLLSVIYYLSTPPPVPSEFFRVGPTALTRFFRLLTRFSAAPTRITPALTRKNDVAEEVFCVLTAQSPVVCLFARLYIGEQTNKRQ